MAKELCILVFALSKHSPDSPCPVVCYAGGSWSLHWFSLSLTSWNTWHPDRRIRGERFINLIFSIPMTLPKLPASRLSRDSQYPVWLAGVNTSNHSCAVKQWGYPFLDCPFPLKYADFISWSGKNTPHPHPHPPQKNPTTAMFTQLTARSPTTLTAWIAKNNFLQQGCSSTWQMNRERHLRAML